MQTKRQSAVETITGNIASFVIGVLVGQLAIYPAYGLHPNWVSNLKITFWFVAVSVVRSYLWRRLFNWIGVVRGDARTGAYAVCTPAAGCVTEVR
jgi:hypothetical protein